MCSTVLTSWMSALLLVVSAVLLAGCGRSGATGQSSTEPAEAEVQEAAAPTVGLDSLRVTRALDLAADLPRLRSLIVARHGEIQEERHFRGPALHAPANVKSVSKSILSALVGIAMEEGHLAGVDQPIAPFFERYLRPDDDPRKKEITIGHLLTMQSGLDRTSGTNYGRWVSSPNWVRYAITRPMIADPGRQRLYSTGNSHLLSSILTQATGQSTWAYARERLAQPLGITLPRWRTDAQGIFFGGNDMLLSPRDMVRFGELYRNAGRLDGKQIVPEWWVRASLTAHTGARRGDGYGYGWFTSRVGGHDMFYAWGYGGQFIFVVPSLELTVVTTSDPDVAREGSHLQAIRQLLAEWIVPAAETGASMHREFQDISEN